MGGPACFYQTSLRTLRTPSPQHATTRIYSPEVERFTCFSEQLPVWLMMMDCLSISCAYDSLNVKVFVFYLFGMHKLVRQAKGVSALRSSPRMLSGFVTSRLERAAWRRG